jgi:hypothetical protein
MKHKKNDYESEPYYPYSDMQPSKEEPKETIHVHYELIIDKDITCCEECPYYKEFQDMCATLSVCDKLPYDSYKNVLGDVCWRNSHTKISEKCPLRKEK